MTEGIDSAEMLESNEEETKAWNELKLWHH